MIDANLAAYTQLQALRTDYHDDKDIKVELIQLIDSHNSFSWLFCELLVYALDYGLEAHLIVDKIDFSGCNHLGEHLLKHVPNTLRILLGYSTTDYFDTELAHPPLAWFVSRLALDLLKQPDWDTTTILALTKIHQQASKHKANLDLSKSNTSSEILGNTAPEPTILDLLKKEGIVAQSFTPMATLHTQRNYIITTTTNKTLFLKIFDDKEIYNKLPTVKDLQASGLSMPRLLASGMERPGKWYYATDYIKTTDYAGLSSANKAKQLARELHTIHSLDTSTRTKQIDINVANQYRIEHFAERIAEERKKNIWHWIDDFEKLYNESIPLLKERPLQFCHGDFKPANTLYDGKRFYIIDFDNLLVDDPWTTDFNMLYLFEKQISKAFVTHFVKAYFNGHVPAHFWQLHRLYSILAHINLYNLHLDFARIGRGRIVAMKEQVEIVAARALFS